LFIIRASSGTAASRPRPNSSWDISTIAGLPSGPDTPPPRPPHRPGVQRIHRAVSGGWRGGVTRPERSRRDHLPGEGCRAVIASDLQAD
jgi:hypothetical protein